jgi:hypothetical protein
MLAEIASGNVVDLGLRGSNPRYVAAGYIVYGHESQVLRAVSFDLSTHRLTSEPSTVLPSVLVYAGGWTQFSVSDAGTAVYALGHAGLSAGLRIAVVDLDGQKRFSRLGPGTYRMPRFSPNGRSVTYDEADQIRMWNRTSGANPVLAAGGQTDFPIWSRDGEYVYFSSRRGGTAGRDVFRVRADGSEPAEQLFRREGDQVPISSSPDGSLLLLNEFSEDRGLDLIIMTASGAFRDFLVAPWNEFMGAISPDGTRIAYVSDESGSPEVYIRSFPSAADAVRVSEEGGGHPVWAQDGSELYYLDLTGSVVWRVGVPGPGVTEPLLRPETNWQVNPADWPVTNWDAHPDGAAFVFVDDSLNRGSDASPTLQLELVTGWFEELREQVR